MNDKQSGKLFEGEERPAAADPGIAASGEAKGYERRRYHRIPATLGLTLTFPDRPTVGSSDMETTTTVNVSPGDVFFLSTLHHKLNIGTDVQLAIDLPVGSTNLFTGKHLQVRGRVTRLGSFDQEDPTRRAVAVRFLKTPRFISDLE